MKRCAPGGLPGRLPSRFHIFNTPGDDDLVHAWKLNRRLIAEFHTQVAAPGSRFVVAVIPTGPQVCDDLLAEEFREAAGDPPSGDDNRFFYERGRAHFTDPGNRLAAEILFDGLLGIVGAVPPEAAPTPHSK